MKLVVLCTYLISRNILRKIVIKNLCFIFVGPRERSLQSKNTFIKMFFLIEIENDRLEYLIDRFGVHVFSIFGLS